MCITSWTEFDCEVCEDTGVTEVAWCPNGHNGNCPCQVSKEIPCPDCQVAGPTSCISPGRNGCQRCDLCEEYGDQEYHRKKEEE